MHGTIVKITSDDWFPWNSLVPAPQTSLNAA